MSDFDWLRASTDASNRAHRRRVLRRWAVILAIVLGSLAVLFGTIAFAIAASGRGLFNPGGARVAPPNVSPGQQFSTWAAGLSPKTKNQIAKDLAVAFAHASRPTLGAAAVGPLTQIFKTLLTSSGSDAAEAAGKLSALTSLLPLVDQKALPGKLIEAAANGAAGQLGKKAVDGLTGLIGDLIHGGPRKDQTVIVIGPGGIETVPLTANVNVAVTVKKNKEPPTSFLWFNRRWGRNDQVAFEYEFRLKHSKEKNDSKNLMTVYRCHHAVREVLGIAPRKLSCE